MKLSGGRFLMRKLSLVRNYHAVVNTFRFSDVFRWYRNGAFGTNELKGKYSCVGTSDKVDIRNEVVKLSVRGLLMRKKY